MPQPFAVSIDRLVDFLQLERDPRSAPGAASYNVRCPFCGRPGQYKMNINTAKDTYRCVKCSGDQKNLGVLDLYGRVRFGTPVDKNNSKELYKSLLKEMNMGSPVQPNGAKRFERRTEWKEIPPATDGTLDHVYTALLALPYLKLNDVHKENLIRRGFDADTIIRNAYASFTTDWIREHPNYAKAVKIYNERKIYEAKKKLRISRDSQDSLIAGMLIGCDLRKAGYTLSGIPGFFKLEGMWFLRLNQGIAIPTRNSIGQIVGIQVRSDKALKDGLRYMTLSSKDLPQGPNVKISRIHFPLGNCPLAKDTKVILTEGPLKADAAVSLFDRPVYFIALQGVSNTKDLPKYLDMFKANGVSVIYDGLDMDKITNPNVAKASSSLARKAKEQNVSIRPMYWDRDYSAAVEKQMKQICESHDMKYDESYSRIEWRIAKNMMVLHEKGIDYLDAMKEKTGKPCANWNPETKGIDDFLLHLKQK